MPALLPAIPFLGKAVGLAKGLIGIGGAAKAAGGVGSAMKAGSMLPGVLGSTGTRMAGQGLANAAFKGGLGKTVFGEMTKGQIASRLAPDAIFGGLAAVQTPGDIGDKLIAGGASAIGGGMGGLVLSRAAGARGLGEGVQLAADFGGSILGDMGGMAAGDALMRGKDKLMGGAGVTPYERMSADQQAQFADQIRQQTLMGAGVLPGLQDRYFDNTGMI